MEKRRFLLPVLLKGAPLSVGLHRECLVLDPRRPVGFGKGRLCPVGLERQQSAEFAQRRKRGPSLKASGFWGDRICKLTAGLWHQVV